MHKFKRHIALISLLVFLIPTFIRLHHTFEKHEHAEVCKPETKQHFHKKVDKECKLCDFTVVAFTLNSTDLYSISFVGQEVLYIKKYFSVISIVEIFFSLRAPPSLI